MEGHMENMSELQRQARVFLAHNPDFLPLPYVEDILFHGGVDRYVVAGGVDINTPEGSHILNREAALYIICLELCNLGLGNRPYQPHPYMYDPVIIAEEEAVDGADAADEQHDDQPGDGVHDPVAVAQPPAEAGDGVQIHGPFVWPAPLPPPPPLIPAPELEPEPQPESRPEPKPKPKLEAKPEPTQPLNWVFGEPPRPEPKPEPNQGPGEYVEPVGHDDNGGIS
jgi:hypothetical protein